MAIGDNSFSNGQGNNSNKLYESNYFSRLKIKNQEQGLVLSAKFYQGLLYLELSKIESNTFKTEPVELVCLSPTKAMLFATEIRNFIEYMKSDSIDSLKAFGVNGGMGEKVSYIGLHTNDNKDIFVTLGKFDNEGRILQHHTLTFNKDYHYSLQWSDIETNKIQKNYNNMIELLQLLKLVDDFANYMNGAAGYSMLDLNRYESGKTYNRFNQIFDKLGIERSSYNRGSSGNNDFLSNSSRVESSHTTIEGIEGIFDD